MYGEIYIHIYFRSGERQRKPEKERKHLQQNVNNWGIEVIVKGREAWPAALRGIKELDVTQQPNNNAKVTGICQLIILFLKLLTGMK